MKPKTPHIMKAAEMPNVYLVRVRCRHCSDQLTIAVIGMESSDMAAETSLLAVRLDDIMEKPEVVDVRRPDGVLLLAAPLNDTSLPTLPFSPPHLN